MENASKALIIAGSILIAIMIISLGIVIFNNFGGTAKKMANMDKQEIAAFNSKITPYVGEHISGTQVNTFLQYCLSVNMSAKQSSTNYQAITVTIKETGKSDQVLDKDSTSYNRVQTGTGVSFKVTAEIDNDTGLMTTITIEQNP